MENTSLQKRQKENSLKQAILARAPVWRMYCYPYNWILFYKSKYFRKFSTNTYWEYCRGGFLIFLSPNLLRDTDIINSVSCFIAHHIFVDIFITINRTVMKFGTQTEVEQIDILWKFQSSIYTKEKVMLINLFQFGFCCVTLYRKPTKISV